MQKNTKLLLVAFAVISIAVMTTGYAYAATAPASDSTGPDTPGAVIAGVDAGTALKSGGMGGLAGVLLSFFTVINKAHNGQSQKMDPYKLGVNFVLGIVIGVALPAIGLNAANINANGELVTIITTAVNYMFLHFTNLALRPLFGNWIKGRHANPQSPQAAAQPAKPDTTHS